MATNFLATHTNPRERVCIASYDDFLATLTHTYAVREFPHNKHLKSSLYRENIKEIAKNISNIKKNELLKMAKSTWETRCNKL